MLVLQLDKVCEKLDARLLSFAFAPLTAGYLKALGKDQQFDVVGNSLGQLVPISRVRPPTNDGNLLFVYLSLLNIRLNCKVLLFIRIYVSNARTLPSWEG